MGTGRARCGAFSFAGVGITPASFGFNIGLDPSTIRSAVAALLLTMGLVLLIPALQNRLALAASPLATGGQALLGRMRSSGLAGQFLLGALLSDRGATALHCRFGSVDRLGYVMWALLEDQRFGVGREARTCSKHA